MKGDHDEKAAELDEFSLWDLPFVPGTGKRRFGKGTIPAGLRAVDSMTSSTGVVMTKYARAGEIHEGSFQLEQPSEPELERRKRVAEE